MHPSNNDNWNSTITPQQWLPTSGQRGLVSVVIPCFNRADCIEQALESVAEQDYRPLECIVVDDGSTDATIERVEEFVRSDKRFSLIKRNRPPKSASTCRNIGWQESQAEFVVFLDSDDVLAPDCLSTRVAAIKSAPDVDFAVFPGVTWTRSLGDGGMLTKLSIAEGDSYLDTFLRGGYPWCISSPLWRRKFLEDISGFDERFQRRQDVEIHTRACLEGNFAVFEKYLPDHFIRLGTCDGPKADKRAFRQLVIESDRIFVHKCAVRLMRGKFDAGVRRKHMKSLSLTMDSLLRKSIWRNLEATPLTLVVKCALTGVFHGLVSPWAALHFMLRVGRFKFGGARRRIGTEVFKGMQ